MAAWKVHIQSGPYSFSFQHRRNDTGLGMISPVWEDPDDEVSGQITRMTLLLHPQIGSEREAIHQQFHKLQDNILLFMRNLCQIRILFYEDGKLKSSTISSRMSEGLAPHRILLTKHVTKDGETRETSRMYHVTEHTVKNLAKNDNRTYSDHEERSKAYSTSNVLLGFPLTSESVPIIKHQDVFAFLPIRPMGFSVSINSHPSELATHSP